VSEPIRKRTRVRCGPGRAFRTFTAEIDRWWPPGHRRFAGSVMVLEPGVGGRFLERATSGEEADLGRVIAWDPPRELAYTWTPGSITGPTTVAIRFVADGGETWIEVTHSEGAAAMGDEWPRRAERFDRSWEQVLPAFERGIETEEERS
jgi:uncharacterized protein YndB with AHSA1/START domain